MTKIIPRVINKYILIPFMVMFMAVTYLVVGLSEVNWGIFAADIALFAIVVLFTQDIKKNMTKKDSEELLRNESPIDWLKISIKLFVSSILSSLVYAFADVQDIGIGQNPAFGLLIFSVLFFLVGLLYTVRIVWFIIDPASQANIFAGKIMKTTKAVSIRVFFLSFVLLLQVINATMLNMIWNAIFVAHQSPTPFILVYSPALVLSFVAMIPFLYQIIFRLNEDIRIRGWIVILCFFSPWVLLISYNLLSGL